MILKKIAALTAFVLVFATSSFGQDFPEKPNRLVNDYTGTLTPNQIENLERKLVAFDDSTSTQVAVVLMRSVGVYDINQYTAELGEKWGVGSKKNNGVVILAALEDRKVAIQTGYGVEGALPDAITKRIIENEIKPNFRAANYYEGLDKATNAVIAATKGEYKNDQPRRRGNGGSSGFPFGILVIIIIAILISRRGGGGGGGKVIGGRGGASPFWWLLMGSQMGRSSGSGWGGFSGGGGSSGGGGFGGFGGGSFGGGGSSGDW
ncbi:TPM domain-containing protein [Desertivirga arenae]|uniref:TPM domain-containing protein n=1 Tax=Desertivirga arenae TaxID=2810309 RepID=UPI001A975507|nr:TPM domain-containing protein [Pedobacter sp. SYSU D00823]